ncbi:uncharacterized protein fs(1)N [Venturia canescens]|uniref:uncharacterized protein fs(1)N n=1 Tax=Venturia canescens TaxID=32260 RepID=UPI001C9D6212|nr:uncharacterized protein LOC122418212 [Venturia canescens]
MDRKLLVSVNLFLLIVIGAEVRSELSEIDKMSKRLDELLVEIDSPKNSFEDSERKMDFWQKYEFGSGVGNREELSIKNVTSKLDPHLKKNIDDYQLIEKNGEFFLAGTENEVFHFYKFDFEQARTIFHIDVHSSGKIQNFLLFVVPKSSTIVAILCVESQQGSDLIWYRFAQGKLVDLDSWPVRDFRVEKLQFFHHRGQNRLLILRRGISSWGRVFISVDVYGFEIDGERPNLWLVQRLNVPQTFDIHVCPSHDNAMIVFRRKNNVITYEFEFNENGEGLFQEHQNVTSNNLRNLVCFESGHVRYLVTSGPEAALFDLVESEFQHDPYSERVFNEIGEISWIQSLLVDNYREESILLVQLKNSSTIILSWKGRQFEIISAPNLELEGVDLSRITVVPKYGYIDGNKLVKIETRLIEKARPVRDDVEKMLKAKYALAEVLQKQKFIFDETESRMKKSYLKNPWVTGFWNMSKIEVETLTIERGVSHDGFAVGGKKLGLQDFLSGEKKVNAELDDLESKIGEIKRNFENSIPIETPEVLFGEDLSINGNLDVRGTILANNLRYDYLNGFTRDEIVQNFSNFDADFVIGGVKSFESIDAERLNVFFINGVPMEEFKFDRIKERDYSALDFSKLSKLKVRGNLNFTTINGANWQELVKKIVLKSQSPIIPGTTIVEGDFVSDNFEIQWFNGILYPEEYVSAKNRDFVAIKGKKRLDKLKVRSLDFDAIESINGVSIDEFITLDGDRILRTETTFENLKVTENLQIDGNVTGLPEDYKAARSTLKETTDVTADVRVTNLTIIGDLVLQDSLNHTTWFELDDLLTIEDENVEITGHKSFLNDVEVHGDLVIGRQTINGHSIEEFVTLDTDQEFPNLEKISGNVTFDHVETSDLEEIKKLLGEDRGESPETKCLAKLLVFKVSPVLDELFFESVNSEINASSFMAATNRTFANVNFQNLRIKHLRGGEIVPIRVNDEHFGEFKSSRISKTKYENIEASYEIGRLETKFLNARTIDGFLPQEIEKLRISLEHFYHRISSGNITFELFNVEGNVDATTVNGKHLESYYDPDKLENAIVSSDLRVKNLIVRGSINAINFTNFVNDSVLKSDRNIVIDAKKTIGRVVCQSLQSEKLNGKSIDLILDPDKHQILEGSLVVRGTVKVLDAFETAGKIGGIVWQEIRDRFKSVGNETFAAKGNISFLDEDVKVSSLLVTERIQGVDIADFQKSVIYKSSKNIVIEGPLIFKNPVTIDSRFVVTETYNDLDLKNFYEKAVRIDRPLNVRSKIVFTKNLHVKKNLVVDDELESETIGGINLKKVHENAVFVDRPTSIPGSVSIGNAIFESDVEIEMLNDIDLRTVLTLEDEQMFGATLRCKNFTVGKLELVGTMNDLSMSAIYDDTLMLNENQNSSNHLIFDGNIHIRSDFEATIMNGIDPKNFISLDGNETLIGNFTFENPLVLDDNLVVKGLFNGIDLMKWEATVVTKNFPIKQIVKGAWTIHGNVHFDKNLHGSDHLDGVNVTKLLGDLHRREVETNLTMEGVKEDLRSFCEDLTTLQEAAENQIYKYEYFDYLDVMNFDRKIISVHQYELEHLDYLLISFDSCHLDVFVFTGMEFTRVTSLSNVGYIERWFTFSCQDEIFFLTVGKQACGKNQGNLWKLDGDRFIFLEDLGNVTDAKKIKEDEFVVMVEDRMIRRSMIESHRNSLTQPKPYKIENADSKFVADSEKLLLINRDTIEKFELENATKKERVKNRFGTENILSCRLGIYGREAFVYYDNKISDNYLFITDDNITQPKILQTINVQRPSSIVVINFDGGVENFLIFIEDQKILQIYEYRGIEGFVHRESIRMKADKIHPLRVRKYSKFAKKHCLAIIQGQRLVILEAKMHGEKSDMEKLDCH